MEDLEDGGAGVEADEVGEGEGNHGVVHAEIHDLIDGVGGGDPFHHAGDGLAGITTDERTGWLAVPQAHAGGDPVDLGLKRQ